MNFLIRIGITALSILILQHFLKGVEVKDWWVSLIVAVVLAFLNAIVKPILQVLTIPITMLSLGFFLLVINAGMIMLADKLVDGFQVNGFWRALLFSILLSLVSGVLNLIFRVSKNDQA